ncbi:hypothetical protein SAMN05443428_1412 [Caloramator quimbayensis]|uniref:Uncharacterized protein n=1 Tax=Caloramator quimbayensis TaxID=1147123 RepID=A0A1T4YFN3_9CLOT|nr:hypothetical protein [Caloramator quimbayensis]SKB00035.1 hypothetical protein SAMN05443428_1412 [Caloramator quimbayensis]
MSDVVIRETNLPDNIEDLSKFILIGREKLTAVRAEIRAIDKVQLAQEVRNQKKEEALMLSEALLDAEVKLGELLKQIPKAPGTRTDLKPIDTAVERLNNQKPKHEVIKDLGFNQKQAERFETLANNKDLVEQVKAEARANDDIPTRTRVLELAKQRKIEQQRQQEEQERREREEYYRHLEFCEKVGKQFLDAVLAVLMLKTDTEHLEALLESFNQTIKIEDKLKDIDLAIEQLQTIKDFLRASQKPRLIK